MDAGDAAPVLLLIPVYNDWDAAAALLARLDQEVAPGVDVLLVDDGSTDSVAIYGPYHRIRRVEVLHLRRNLGHQRAIAVALNDVATRAPHATVVVMDGDGEDRPDHVPVLLAEYERLGRQRVVFAARSKRLEGATFRLFYRLYRIAHRVLTGVPVRIGNFSVLPPAAVSRLMASPELWSHYAAAVVRTRIPHASIPLPRGERLAGRPRMSFLTLLLHGLSAISVFSDVVSARLLAAAVTLLLGSGIAILAVVAVRFGTGLAIPGWATYAAGVFAIIFLQAFMLSLLLVFNVLAARTQLGFLPARDAGLFVLRRTTLWRPPAVSSAPGVAG
jgi:glycosyltransferase involved in cell wall biosynthesis